MNTSDRTFGFSDTRLCDTPTVYADGLFAGKTVIVTGAGSGLGKAIATLFARLGADLAVAGRDSDKLEAAASFLRRFGTRVEAYPLNIRDPDAVETFFAKVSADLGIPDIVVNNAGGQFPQAAIDFSRKGWNAVIDTNLNGTWWMMQSAAQHWVKAGHPGSIINIVADIWRGLPGIAHSCAARAGVVYLSKTVAVEWAPHAIRVNCVAPGCVETTGFGVYPPEGAQSYWEANPFRRPGDEWDIAESVAYLAAPSGKFITGEVLTVDGGQQMWGDPWPTGRPAAFEIGGGSR
ncbi:MAG: citronellol/citronellal dehydrogenase [Rhodobacteraceae bacterium HLUCCA12]|nr:MAG: citronellol/citronellal dehydrogenase [Rhodobacteraceae bacterium HLUCCA12]